MKKIKYYFIGLICLSACKSFFEQKRENIVSTGDLKDVSITSAEVAGALFDVGDDKKKKIITYGHVWSTEIDPAVEDANDFKTDYGARNTFGDFSSNLFNLTPETTYYVRAYAQNEERVTYGRTITFIPGLVRTLNISNIAKTSAKVRGTISTLVNPERKGFCWATSSKPTVNNSTANASNISTIPNGIEANIQGLSEDTKYFIRAFAVYDGGKVTYGDEFFFKTTE